MRLVRTLAQQKKNEKLFLTNSGGLSLILKEYPALKFIILKETKIFAKRF